MRGWYCPRREKEESPSACASRNHEKALGSRICQDGSLVCDVFNMGNENLNVACTPLADVPHTGDTGATLPVDSLTVLTVVVTSGRCRGIVYQGTLTLVSANQTKRVKRRDTKSANNNEDGGHLQAI